MTSGRSGGSGTSESRNFIIRNAVVQLVTVEIVELSKISPRIITR